MGGSTSVASHAAEAAALGFYYQAFFALLTLLAQDTDNAAIGIEQLDDVELKTDGHTLLYQLKHSISTTPPAVTLKSRALWRTMKVWIDILPALTLSETTLNLVAVGGIPSDSPLKALTNLDADRAELVEAMKKEAQHVVDARAAAVKAEKPLPYADRVDGCEAFLALSETERLNLLRRTRVLDDSPAVPQIEDNIAEHLKILPAEQRPMVAKRLVEWWDRQIIYTLCDKRDRIISRTELQQQISAIIGDIEQGKLLPDFETVNPPEDYQPDSVLARQIRLVEGKPSDLAKAIREEWKAREQRSRWLNGNPGMATTIHEYDRVLEEHWSDRHCQMVEDCAGLGDKEKCAHGLKILRWTHEEAPNIVRPIAQNWNAAYYVRGSYQVLAINLKVGWHPEYAKLLEGDE
ncbi:ABC-three component system protein [Azospirillum halopraeferens]|uniref:ABC-three component system protein n=1 Tax=Azospirillum halopraeferens TaxID=34010 RepID=UPI00040BE8AF|nr:ABC-three component system protein [Azospirillum halopraeferens]